MRGPKAAWWKPRGAPSLGVTGSSAPVASPEIGLRSADLGVQRLPWQIGSIANG
jgi:hypothetical protein